MSENEHNRNLQRNPNGAIVHFRVLDAHREAATVSGKRPLSRRGRNQRLYPRWHCHYPITILNLRRRETPIQPRSKSLREKRE
jgi:hypothetical protein